MLSWTEFAGEIAEVAGTDASAVRPSTRLVRDLDADSLSLAEIAMLVVDGTKASFADLERLAWDRITAQDLYEFYVRGSKEAS